jgi:hypothetical protein
MPAAAGKLQPDYGLVPAFAEPPSQGFGEPGAMAWQAERQPVSVLYKFDPPQADRSTKSETRHGESVRMADRFKSSNDRMSKTGSRFEFFSSITVAASLYRGVRSGTATERRCYSEFTASRRPCRLEEFETKVSAIPPTQMSGLAETGNFSM